MTEALGLVLGLLLSVPVFLAAWCGLKLLDAIDRRVRLWRLNWIRDLRDD